MITVKEIKEWLEQFPDDYEVETKMDCFYGTVELVTFHDNIEYNLEMNPIG